MRAVAPFYSLCTLLCCLLLSMRLEATLKLHLQIDAIDGESKAQDFDGWTDLMGVSHGGSNTTTIGSGAPSAGNFTAKALSLKMKMSAAHPYIAARVANGQPVPEMRLQMVRQVTQGATSVLVDYVFYDVYFESANTTVNEGQQIESEVTFFYSSLEWSVVTFNSQGAAQNYLTITHDATMNTALLLNGTGGIPTGNSGGNGSSDTDSDGMPNSWETTYGLDPNSDADKNTDLDGDGFSNYLEYLAGTIPNNSTHFLKITQIDLTTAHLEWASTTGKIYQVQQAIDGLDSSDWNTLSEVTAGAGSTSSYTLPNTSTQNKVFYRVRLKP